MARNASRENKPSLVTTSAPAKILGFALIPPFLVAVIATWATITDSWHWLRVRHAFGVVYADLRQVTATADCIMTDASWSMESPTCDAFGRGYNYPSLWARAFAALGLGEARTVWVAVVMMAVFSVCIFIVSLLSAWLVRPLVPLACVTVAAVAPPTWLALERGNVDVFVFTLVVIGALLFVLRKSWLSAILLAIASVSKIFPLGAALILVRDRKQRPRNVVIFVSFVATGTFLTFSEFRLINQRTPQPTAMSFGASSLFQGIWNRLDAPFGDWAPRLLGVVLFAALTLALARSVASLPRVKESFSSAVDYIARDRISATLVLSGGGPLLFAFLLGTNFDYRLIFAIPLIGGMARAGALAAFPVRLLVVALVLQSWLTYPTPIWIQRVSDLLWVLLAPCVAYMLLRVTSSSAHHRANK